MLFRFVCLCAISIGISFSASANPTVSIFWIAVGWDDPTYVRQPASGWGSVHNLLTIEWTSTGHFVSATLKSRLNGSGPWLVGTWSSNTVPDNQAYIEAIQDRYCSNTEFSTALNGYYNNMLQNFQVYFPNGVGFEVKVDVLRSQNLMGCRGFAAKCFETAGCAENSSDNDTLDFTPYQPPGFSTGGYSSGSFFAANTGTMEDGDFGSTGAWGQIPPFTNGNGNNPQPLSYAWANDPQYGGATIVIGKAQSRGIRGGGGAYGSDVLLGTNTWVRPVGILPNGSMHSNGVTGASFTAWQAWDGTEWQNNRWTELHDGNYVSVVDWYPIGASLNPADEIRSAVSDVIGQLGQFSGGQSQGTEWLPGGDAWWEKQATTFADGDYPATFGENGTGSGDGLSRTEIANAVGEAMYLERADLSAAIGDEVGDELFDLDVSIGDEVADSLGVNDGTGRSLAEQIGDEVDAFNPGPNLTEQQTTDAFEAAIAGQTESTEFEGEEGDIGDTTYTTFSDVATELENAMGGGFGFSLLPQSSVAVQACVTIPFSTAGFGMQDFAWCFVPAPGTIVDYVRQGVYFLLGLSMTFWAVGRALDVFKELT